MDKTLLLFVLGSGLVSDANPYMTLCPKDALGWPLNYLEKFSFKEPKGVLLLEDAFKSQAPHPERHLEKSYQLSPWIKQDCYTTSTGPQSLSAYIFHL